MAFNASVPVQLHIAYKERQSTCSVRKPSANESGHAKLPSHTAKYMLSDFSHILPCVNAGAKSHLLQLVHVVSDEICCIASCAAGIQ